MAENREQAFSYALPSKLRASAKQSRSGLAWETRRFYRVDCKRQYIPRPFWDNNYYSDSCRVH